MTKQALRERALITSHADPETRLSELLKALRRRLGASAAMAVVRDAPTQVLTPLGFVGHSEASRSEYIRHFHRIDPMHGEFVQGKFRDGVHFLSEIIPARRFERTDFFNDYWNVHRHGDAVGIFGRIGPDQTFNIAFAKAHGAGEFHDDVRATLDEARPYIRQAILAARERRMALLKNQVRNPLVNHLPLGIFLVTEDLELLECSEGGEELLARKNSFSLKKRALSHSDKSIDANLRSRLQMLSREFDPVEPEPRPRELVADISSNHHSPQNVYVLPVLADFRPRFLLIVTDLSHPADRHMIQRSLIALFGLTPAEAEVAASVFEGQSTKWIAKNRGVKRETVRGQLKSIFQKTHCASRVELARKISALVVPFR